MWFVIAGFKNNSNILINIKDSIYHIYRSENSDRNNHRLSSYGIVERKKNIFLFKDSIVFQPTLQTNINYISDMHNDDSIRIKLTNQFYINPRSFELFVIRSNDTLVISDGTGKVGNYSYCISKVDVKSIYFSYIYPSNINEFYKLYTPTMTLNKFNSLNLEIELISTYRGINKHPMDLFLDSDTAFLNKNKLSFSNGLNLKFQRISKSKVKKIYPGIK